jgi:hypothetical protein
VASIGQMVVILDTISVLEFCSDLRSSAPNRIFVRQFPSSNRPVAFTAVLSTMTWFDFIPISVAISRRQ